MKMKNHLNGKKKRECKVKSNLAKAILKEILSSNLISEGLRYHIEKDVGVDMNLFRPGSKSFFSLFREARELHRVGIYQLKESESYYIKETDIGNFGEFNGSLVPLDFPMYSEDDLFEAEYKGKKVKLNKPSRNSGSSGGQFKVYVKNPKTGKVKKVTFGSREMKSRLGNPKARKSFAARHRCEKTTKKDKISARYWSCRLGRYPHLTGSKKKYRWW